MSTIRTFHFERVEDVNGVSGVGRVAEGIEFSDGTVVVHWQAESIHGHGGRTRLVWHDTMPPVNADAAEAEMT